MGAELDTIRTGEHTGKGRMVFGGELPWHRDGVKLTPDEQRRFDRVVELIDVPLEKRPYYVPAPTGGPASRPRPTRSTCTGPTPKRCSARSGRTTSRCPTGTRSRSCARWWT